jgi:hypothetical protein
MRSDPSPSQKSDSLLTPYLDAGSDRGAEKQLGLLLEQTAFPIVDRVLHTKLGSSQKSAASDEKRKDMEDLRGEIVLRLIARLRSLRRGSPGQEIANFPGYVAETAYRAVNGHWRKVYPRRFSLENQVRHLLQEHPDLALWQIEQGEWLCGFVAWHDPGRPGSQRGGRRHLLFDVHVIERDALAGESAAHMSPVRLVAAVFDWAGCPILLAELVGVVAELWNIRDGPPDPLPEKLDRPDEDTVREQVLRRITLQQCWQEIRRLPAKQIAAIILDTEENMVRSLVDVAEIPPGEIIEALELPVEVVALRLPDFPLKDAEIAAVLGISSNWVAKMRMVARRNLQKRMEILGL